ncbi:MAG: MFS transporter, partial [bacterium]|nr:MFS transporter [bacterium]
LRLQQEFSAEQHTSSSQLINQLFATATQSGFWLGILFALIAGAGFKSLEVYYGPFLIDRGMSEEAIGWFSMGPMILMMLGGAMYGGRLADRASPHRICKISLFGMAGLMGCLALSDLMSPVAGWWHCLLLTGISFGIGAFTVSMYAMLMNLAQKRFAATQFSCFMGAVNGCEAWSGWLSGKLIAAWDYPAAMLVLGAMSLTALPLLSWMKRTGD